MSMSRTMSKSCGWQRDAGPPSDGLAVASEGRQPWDNRDQRFNSLARLVQPAAWVYVAACQSAPFSHNPAWRSVHGFLKFPQKNLYPV